MKYGGATVMEKALTAISESETFHRIKPPPSGATCHSNMAKTIETNNLSATTDLKPESWAFSTTLDGKSKEELQEFYQAVESSAGKNHMLVGFVPINE